jgi:feruloyl esterase
LPLANWNGKFLAVGNGGFAGSIEYAFMAAALRRGYATSSTDGGHVGDSSDGSFALGHPEKAVDLGHRAVHEMTVVAEALIAAFYGDGPKFSYWNGCSQGGRQGLREAQQYPADYDGIIAGAAAANQPNHYSGSLWVASATLKDPASFIPKRSTPSLAAPFWRPVMPGMASPMVSSRTHGTATSIPNLSRART